MGRRVDLNESLVQLLGSRNVYFQPPETIKMLYPCIVYEWSGNDVKYADDIPYHIVRQYSVTVIDGNPDSEIPDRIATLPFCKLNRVYRADNLYHFAFTIYY